MAQGPDSTAIVADTVFADRLVRLEQWLWNQGFVELRLGAAPKDAELAREVAALSDLYTTERAALARERGGANSAQRLRAKLGFFLCSDAPKVYRVLVELERRGALARAAEGGSLRALDLGSGVGSAGVGLLLSLNPASIPSVVLHAVDADRPALEIGDRIVRRAASIAGLELRASREPRDLNAGPPDRSAARFDLVLIQSLLNELFLDMPAPQRLARCAAWLESALAGGDGLTIVIEPALREPTRTLHRIRDLLVDARRAAVWAPCPHQQPCPMLARARDWCHERTVFAPPPKVAALQALTRRRDQRLNYSFVVLGRYGQAPAAAPARWPPSAGRLVSDALPSKGKLERLLCAGDGALRRLRLLTRDQTEANALLGLAPRGELVRCSELSSPRIAPDTRVEGL
ncbi:MAG TPA: small ribosomal subunit Rsm22 family protein [Acidobacteriota bacterium]